MSQEVYDSIPENEFNCRTSDYRTVASDPNYDVIDVKADVDRKSGLTLMALTVVPKIFNTTLQLHRVTSIYSYSTVDCYSRDDF